MEKRFVIVDGESGDTVKALTADEIMSGRFVAFDMATWEERRLTGEALAAWQERRLQNAAAAAQQDELKRLADGEN